MSTTARKFDLGEILRSTRYQLVETIVEHSNGGDYVLKEDNNNVNYFATLLVAHEKDTSDFNLEKRKNKIIQYLKSIQSSVILEFKDCLILPNTQMSNNNKDNILVLFIVERCQNETLETVIYQIIFRDHKKVSEDALIYIFYQILLGINYLHTNNIVHGNLCPFTLNFLQKIDRDDNIYLIGGDNESSQHIQLNQQHLDKFKVKFNLFYIQSVVKSLDIHTIYRNSYYTSPEINNEMTIRNNQNNQDTNINDYLPTFSDDIWSLGVIILGLCTIGYYDHKLSTGNLRSANNRYFISRELGGLYSDELIDVICLCLSYDIQKRPTSSTLMKSHLFKRIRNEYGNL